MSESQIYRTRPAMRKSTVYVWDEKPLPKKIEVYESTCGGGLKCRRILCRHELEDGTYALIGDGTRRVFEFGSGWDCSFEECLITGHSRTTQQKLLEDSVLRTTVRIKTPEMARQSKHHGVYRLSADGFSGGGRCLGLTDIRRIHSRLLVSIENCRMEVRREWRIEHPWSGRAELYDLQELEPLRPFMIASADDDPTLFKMMRLLILDLTHVMMPESCMQVGFSDMGRIAG